MNAVVQHEPNLPAPVARRGIDEAAWRTAMNSLFPGARAESVLMVFDYCKARKLDPLKKPCHIVPMKVKQGDDYVWRDVVMPGIYEYRTTAMRTGQYMGHSKPVYGPQIDHLGVNAPQYCEITVYRWNEQAKQRCEYPVQVLFTECAATTKDYKTKEIKLNDRWTRAPQQMLTKCTEAAALREAFPDELGGEHTAEEMEGQAQSQTEDTVITGSGANPRPDTSGVDWELRDKWVSRIADTLQLDKEEHEISQALVEIDRELNEFPELYTTVFDKLAEDGIITKANWKKYLRVHQRPEGR